MSWKENLQSAQFRDAKFFVLSRKLNGGRRLVLHDFPFQDIPFVEDLGRRAKSFNVEAFVLGEGYLDARDALIAALDTQGSGPYFDPYRFTSQVCCESYDVQESAENGGMAWFSIEFKESGEKLSALVSPDRAAQVAAASQDTRAQALDKFSSVYEVINEVKSGIQKAKDQVNHVMDEMKKAQKLCADAAQLGQDFSQLVKEVSNGLDQIISYPNKVSALFESSFAALSSSIDGFLSKTNPDRAMAAASMIGGISGTMASPNQSVTTKTQVNTTASDSKRLSAWTQLSQYTLPQNNILNSTSLEANTEKKNAQIIQSTTRVLGLSYLADCAASAQFATASDVQATRASIMALSDEILSGDFISDEMFSSIGDLQVAVVNALNAVENELPLLTNMTTTSPTNSLCFLYENFSKIDNEADLISRNDIADPGEIPANTKLEVML